MSNDTNQPSQLQRNLAAYKAEGEQKARAQAAIDKAAADAQANAPVRRREIEAQLKKVHAAFDRGDQWEPVKVTQADVNNGLVSTEAVLNNFVTFEEGNK